MKVLVRSGLMLCAALAAGFLCAAEAPLVATGVAKSYRGAVNDALMSAVEQRSGVTVSVSERAQFTTSADDEAKGTNGVIDETSRQSARDQVNKDVSKWASGKISSYRVLSDAFDPATRQYRVEVEVTFPEKYRVGLDPDNRKRLAIANFRVQGREFEWYGQKGSTVEWAMSFADKLNVRFVKTRRFTMLERKFTAEINDELAQLADANIAPTEVVRKACRLGTDYLVVGEVRFFPVRGGGTNPLTGQAMPAGRQPFAEVTYRVLLAPTGQLKFADTVKIDASSFAATGLGDFVSQTTDAAAALVMEGVFANYLPRNEADDGTARAPVAVETPNATPVALPPASAPVTDVRGTPDGGVVTPF